jgi:hypothetical protein
MFFAFFISSFSSRVLANRIFLCPGKIFFKQSLNNNHKTHQQNATVLAVPQNAAAETETTVAALKRSKNDFMWCGST